jgi:hypothetical protein
VERGKLFILLKLELHFLPVYASITNLLSSVQAARFSYQGQLTFCCSNRSWTNEALFTQLKMIRSKSSNKQQDMESLSFELGRQAAIFHGLITSKDDSFCLLDKEKENCAQRISEFLGFLDDAFRKQVKIEI